MFLIHTLAIKNLSSFKKVGPYIVHKRIHPSYSFLKLRVKLWDLSITLHFWTRMNFSWASMASAAWTSSVWPVWRPGQWPCDWARLWLGWRPGQQPCDWASVTFRLGWRLAASPTWHWGGVGVKGLKITIIHKIFCLYTWLHVGPDPCFLFFQIVLWR
jgi:hypothetical protein